MRSSIADGVIRTLLGASVLTLTCTGLFAEHPPSADDPLARWRAGVSISRVVPAEAHSIHTYFNTSPESPDGRWVLYFSSSDPKGELGEIHAVERETGHVRVLASGVATEDAHRVACQQWLSAGRRVAFHQVLADGQWLVSCVDMESGESRVLARDRQLGFGSPMHDVAPLYGRHWNPGEHRDLELLDVATGEIRETAFTADAFCAAYPELVVAKFGDRPISVFFPILSPDLSRVFCKFATPAGGDFRSSRASDRYGLACFDLQANRFLFVQEDWGHPAWHPDSRHVLNVGGFVTDCDTGRRTRTVIQARLRGSHPSFAPDGRLFASDFIVETEAGTPQQWGVGVGDIQTGEFVVLQQFDNSRGARSWRPSHPHPVFSADGRRLYFNASSDRWTRLHVAEAAR